jgi:hypothetical protein
MEKAIERLTMPSFQPSMHLQQIGGSREGSSSGVEDGYITFKCI